MSWRFQIRHEIGGPWSLSGLADRQSVEFDELGASLAHAKRECAAAPALIEVICDGVYVAAYQSEGWPHALCRSAGSGGQRRRHLALRLVVGWVSRHRWRLKTLPAGLF